MATTEKQVSIPEGLFLNLIKYHFVGQKSEDLDQAIAKALEEKVDKMVKHDLYTKFKTATTEEQKEKARQEYLDKAGISSNFRW